MDYFYQSPFYDRTSLNESVRIQHVSDEKAEETFKNKQGVSFTRQYEDGTIYLIAKQIREKPNSSEVKFLAFFYILNTGDILMSPTLYSVVESRLVCKPLLSYLTDTIFYLSYVLYLGIRGYFLYLPTHMSIPLKVAVN